MEPERKPPRSLKETFFFSTSLPALLGEVKIVLEIWYKLLPSSLADRTFPVGVKGDALVIGVPHPAYATEIQIYKERILKEFKKRFPSFQATRLEWVVWEEEESSEPLKEYDPQNP